MTNTEDCRWLDMRDGRQYGIGNRRGIPVVVSLRVIDVLETTETCDRNSGNCESLYIPQLFSYHLGPKTTRPPGRKIANSQQPEG